MGEIFNLTIEVPRISHLVSRKIAEPKPRFLPSYFILPTCPLVSPLYLERLRVGELARVIDEVASLVEECRVGGRLFLYLPFSKPLPLEGLGEAVTRTSTTPPYSSTLQGSLAATACGLCSPGTSVARRSPSGVAVAGR